MSSTPAEKVKYLNETKVAIKDAIVAKGVEVAEDATFRSYADSIAAIDTRLPEQEKTITITENGSYEVKPDAGHVISKVTAAVGITIPEPVIEAIEIIENGTYTAPAGVDGYSPITVNVPTGGGGDIEVEPIVLTGDCSYACSGNIASQYIALYGDTISTSGIMLATRMFANYKNATIPFEINMDNSTYRGMDYMFGSATNLTELPKINNAYPSTLSNLFYDCDSLRTIPEDYMDTWNFSRIYSYQYSSVGSVFWGCCSLRTIPPKILLKLRSDVITSTTYKVYSGLSYLYALDELIGVPVDGATIINNVFSNFGTSCERVKNIIFETNEDGSAKEAKWKTQTIDLSTYCGYTLSSAHITDYNSGITGDKKVNSDTTYQALKNDPDWFASGYPYSRYNHDSAVATINSLPDTSAYLATAGGTNTIKFRGAAGEKTDGGAINTLTEEEIAVATAKGWTVTLA